MFSLNVVAFVLALGILIFSIYASFYKDKKLRKEHPSFKPYAFGYFVGTILTLESIRTILLLIILMSGFELEKLITIMPSLRISTDMRLIALIMTFIRLVVGIGILLRKKWSWVLVLGIFLANVITDSHELYQQPLQNIQEPIGALFDIIISIVVFICTLIYFLKRRKELSWT